MAVAHLLPLVPSRRADLAAIWGLYRHRLDCLGRRLGRSREDDFHSVWWRAFTWHHAFWGVPSRWSISIS